MVLTLFSVSAFKLAILVCCSSAREDSLPRVCLRGLARHFKTDHTETVALCFGYPKTPCLRVEGKLSSRADEQAISLLGLSVDLIWLRLGLIWQN
jgi:hypothetical protein